MDKVILVNSNQNEQDFGKFYGFLSGKSGRLLITGLWGSHIRNLPLLVTLWAAVQGMCLHGGWEAGLVSVKDPCRTLRQLNVGGAILWTTLAKLFSMTHEQNYSFCRKITAVEFQLNIKLSLLHNLVKFLSHCGLKFLILFLICQRIPRWLWTSHFGCPGYFSSSMKWRVLTGYWWDSNIPLLGTLTKYLGYIHS